MSDSTFHQLSQYSCNARISHICPTATSEPVLEIWTDRTTHKLRCECEWEWVREKEWKRVACASGAAMERPNEMQKYKCEQYYFLYFDRFFVFVFTICGVRRAAVCTSNVKDVNCLYFDFNQVDFTHKNNNVNNHQRSANIINEREKKLDEKYGEPNR